MAMVERDQLPAHPSQREEMGAAARRRLTRLRFDLHDGPQQDLVLLAEDIRLLRAQLEAVLEGHPDKARVLGRFDDVDARLDAIDGDLRRIAAFAESPFLPAETVPLAIAKINEEFTVRTGIVLDSKVEGEFEDLTDSQQITLLGVIREALSNIREHSEAHHVTIAVEAGPAGVAATISDDGHGFDPERALLEAGRGGNLGLVGMHERVRLLGGQTTIDSRPGGPTTVSVQLPPYHGPARGR
jgi:signal transduction histidine kinase